MPQEEPMTVARTMDADAADAEEQAEEEGRAALYGLLASLFYAPPAPSLLDSIAAGVAAGDGILQQAWNAVATAARETDAQSVNAEYGALFLGVGKPEILLYGSFYLSGFMMEKPLAELRTDLARLGLERDEGVAESEDHIASLCETMRFLITPGQALAGSLDVQRRFFATHMQPWVVAMCETIEQHPDARFYRTVARFAKAFFEVETQAFDMALPG